MTHQLAPRAAVTHFETRPLTPTIGAEIHGVDLAGPLSDAMIADIRTALLTHKVIFFRDQDISRAAHIAFARRFGDLEIHPMTPKDQPDPEILELNSGPNMRTHADHWHSDVTWRAEPSLGSILRARIVPDVGGDTLWTDMNAAYEGLSPLMKQWLCGQTAVHDGATFATMQGKPAESFHALYPPQHHPIVRTHPETGARSLYVNSGFTKAIDGLSAKESDWLLDHLFAQVAVPEYQCRFRWEPHSIAFWDNRATQHYATANYLPALRGMDRVTVKGDRPFFDPDR